MVIQVVDSFSNEPQKVVPLITTSLAGGCDVENNKSCGETSGRNNETVASGSSKGGSPSTGDETVCIYGQHKKERQKCREWT